MKEWPDRRFWKEQDITVIYPHGRHQCHSGCHCDCQGTQSIWRMLKLFLEFTVSTDVQRLVEEAFFRRTVRNDMEEYATSGRQKLKAIDYDIHWAAREKENILNSMGDVTEENR
ncbi:MAG: hypothetical protein ACLR6I_11560 [Waltera sp.]